MKNFPKEFQNLIRKISMHDSIVIFNHVYPDFDALGSQYGLYYWIKENFPKKKVFVAGEYKLPNLFSDLFFSKTPITTSIIKNSLAIICDVIPSDRVDDQNYKIAKDIFVIDHHILRPNTVINEENFLVDEKASSTSEIIGLLVLNQIEKYKINQNIMKCIFIGIFTDTGRFFHSNTNANTFYVVYKFMEFNLDIYELNKQLGTRNLKDCYLDSNILNNMTLTSKGLAYYILKDEDYKKHGIEYDSAKNKVYVMSGIKEIVIWMLCSYDIKNKEYRLSLRSREYSVNKVAQKYGGGGHEFASGCKLKDIKALPNIIEELEALIK